MRGGCGQCNGGRTVQRGCAHSARRAYSAAGGCALSNGGACNAGERRGGCSAERRGLEAVWHPGGRGWRFPRSRRAGGKRQPVPPLCDFPPRCTVPRRGSPNPLPRPSPPHVRGHRRQQQQRGLKAGRRGPAGREPPLPPPPGIFFFFSILFLLYFSPPSPLLPFSLLLSPPFHAVSPPRSLLSPPGAAGAPLCPLLTPSRGRSSRLAAGRVKAPGAGLV